MTKTCFIISSIGKEGSDIREKANDKLEFLFKPVLTDLGFGCIRADDEDIPGSISRKIVERVIDSELVIADISDENPNVFYELAIRNAVHKPVIIIKSHEQKPPFDIQDTRAISVDMSKPKSWHTAKKQLENQIKETIKDPKQGSLSILSDFVFQIKERTTDDVSKEVLMRVKDLEDKINRSTRSESGYLNYLITCKGCGRLFESSRKNTLIIHHNPTFSIEETCRTCGLVNVITDKELLPDRSRKS